MYIYERTLTNLQPNNICDIYRLIYIGPVLVWATFSRQIKSKAQKNKNIETGRTLRKDSYIILENYFKE